MIALSLNHISKSFGSQHVIDDLSFEVPEHAVFGFLGQNGAGKTTTMKMILGLLKPNDGTISVFGEKVNYGQNKTNQYIGYLPDVPEFYNFMNPYEYLKLCGEITRLPDKQIKNKSSELLELVGLHDTKKKIGSYSRGMKQRLGIAQALLNDPKLLICDEPTSALDPIGRKEILDIISAVKGNTTVLFSTHILSDVERICDNIVVIHNGKLVLSGTLSDIKAKHKSDGLLLEFFSTEDMEKFQASISNSSFFHVSKSDSGIILHTADIKQAEEEVFQMLVEFKIFPKRLEVIEPTLEHLFMEVVK